MSDNLKFKEAMEKLEKIVDELEKGDLDLDEAINKFEEGIKLSKLLKKKLDEAEQKIEIIKKKEIKGYIDESGESIDNEKKEDYVLEDKTEEMKLL